MSRRRLLLSTTLIRSVLSRFRQVTREGDGVLGIDDADTQLVLIFYASIGRSQEQYVTQMIFYFEDK